MKFGKPKYVGDPINAVRIFNDKEVDELIILDIDASKEKRSPNYDFVADIVGEAFMPIGYGGGITHIDHAEKLFFNGVEKVILNTALFKHIDLVSDIAKRYGNQSVVASIDFKKGTLGQKKLFSHSSAKIAYKNIVEFAQLCQDKGAGEIMLNAVNKDGTYTGYDLDVLSSVASKLNIPVIICGGASDKNDFVEAEKNGASAMAAGSIFVFQRPNQAVLIQYLNDY